MGWRVAANMKTEMVLDALEMAIWSRGDQSLDQLVHHSDRGRVAFARFIRDSVEACG